MQVFKPKIVGFLCHWCAYGGADAAGRARKQYPANLRFVRMMCSGRVDPIFVLKAFKEGADGVLVLGCHPGECHHLVGNHHAQKRMMLLRAMLEPLGVDQRRLRLDWVAAGEFERFVWVITEMVDVLKHCGPLRSINPENISNPEEYRRIQHGNRGLRYAGIKMPSACA